MAAYEHLDIALFNYIDEETGDAVAGIKIAATDSEGRVVQELGTVEWDVGQAKFVGINLLMAAQQIEVESAMLLAMRSMKVTEEEIIVIMEEANKIMLHRRSL